MILMVLVLIVMVIIVTCSGIAWGGIHCVQNGHCWDQDCGRD